MVEFRTICHMTSHSSKCWKIKLQLVKEGEVFVWFLGLWCTIRLVELRSYHYRFRLLYIWAILITYTLLTYIISISQVSSLFVKVSWNAFLCNTHFRFSNISMFHGIKCIVFSSMLGHNKNIWFNVSLMFSMFFK